MKIAFDGKRAVQNMTGLGNYSRRVIDALATTYPDDQFLILCPRVRHHAALDALLGHNNVSIGAAPHPHLGHLWRSGSGIRRDASRWGAHLYHGLSAELPLGIDRSNMAGVVTVHDLIYRHFPEHFSAIDRWIYNHKTAYACRHAHRVIAVSEFTKREVVEAFQIDPGKIDVVYPMINANYGQDITQDMLDEARHTYGLPERYVLVVGRFVYHKNMLLPIRTLPLLDDKRVALVMVGKDTSYWRDTLQPAITREGLQSRVVRIPWVEDRLMPAVYALAQAMVFPSLREGFGLPVLEAQQCGTPVVAATGSSLGEAGGDAACFFDPHDVEALAGHLNRILADEAYAQDLSRQGKRHARSLSPEVTVRQLRAVYDHALSLAGINHDDSSR